MPPVRDLTIKQQRFVDEYLVDGNATAAYQRAGYRATSQNIAAVEGHKLLKNPKIAAAIRDGRQALSVRAQITQDEWLRELQAVGRFDIRGLFHPDGTLKAPHELNDVAAAVVASIEVSEVFEGRGRTRKRVGSIRKVRLWDKLAALEKIGKHFGWLKDRLALEGSVIIQTVAGVDESMVLGLRPSTNGHHREAATSGR